MPFSEAVVAAELDRLIGSTTLRIEQQRIHVEESSASSAQVARAERELSGMLQGLQRLKSQRARY